MTFEEILQKAGEKIKDGEENIPEDELFAYMMFGEPLGDPIGS